MKLLTINTKCLAFTEREYLMFSSFIQMQEEQNDLSFKTNTKCFSL